MTRDDRSAFLTAFNDHMAHSDPAPVNMTVATLPGACCSVTLHQAPHSVIAWLYGWLKDFKVNHVVTAHLTTDGIIIS